MKPSKASSITRDTLLRAASQVIISNGIEALTLNAVAQQAEVSKGGLLYHFPNKNALIVGLGEQLIRDFELTLQAEFDQDTQPGAPGQWIRAYVRSTLRTSERSLALIARLSSVLSEMPVELLQSVKAYEARWYERLESDGLDPIQATIIQLAVDGIWFSKVFQMATPNKERIAQVVERLLLMAQASE